MKISILIAAILSLSLYAQCQNESSLAPKQRIYAEVGIGFGQTLFFGDIDQRLNESLGGSFDPGLGNNLMMGFFFSPEKWKGFGIGSRIKGTFGTPIDGDNGNSYIFNYYNLAIAGKYYVLSKNFNRGIYLRSSAGFGQLTTKRSDEPLESYTHQYAIGTTFMGGLGYSIPLKKSAISFEAEFEFSNRSGTINGIGEETFQSGQIGGNFIWSF